ncbi:MAG: RNA polymerase sigma factor [Gemmatimonadota bacterium]
MSIDCPQPERTDADRAWFGRRVEDLRPELIGKAMKLCGNRPDAEDLVGETLANAWASLPSLNDRSALRAWTFRILKNVFASQCRSPRARCTHEEIDTVADASAAWLQRSVDPTSAGRASAWWVDPARACSNRMLREDLERAVEAMPEPFRSTVVMIDVQGRTYEEAARALERPVGTVRSRLARGRSRLRSELQDHAVEAGISHG